MTNKVTESARRAGEAASETLDKATATVRETATAARATAERALQDTRDRAAQAIATTRKTARSAGKRTAAGVEQNPLALLIGGLTLGAIAGSLIPRTEREAKALGGVGKRIRAAAGDAAQAAKAAGVETLDSLGVNSRSAKQQASKLLDNAVEAAEKAGRAAVSTAKETAKKKS